LASRSVVCAGARVWLFQSISGGLLVVLGGTHLVAQHLLAPTGLRTYEYVVSYLRQPAAFALETAFLATVVVHALLGVRSIALDLGPGARWQRRLDLGLVALGLAMVCYAVALTLRVIAG